jgi:anti-sigma B factor antagonist
MVCRVTGEVDIATAPALREHLLAALDQPGHRILLDLSAVTFMDASGLDVLVFVKRMAVRRGGALRLLAPPAAICRLLTASGLLGYFAMSRELVAAEHTELILPAT